MSSNGARFCTCSDWPESGLRPQHLDCLCTFVERRQIKKGTSQTAAETMWAMISVQDQAVCVRENCFANTVLISDSGHLKQESQWQLCPRLSSWCAARRTARALRPAARRSCSEGVRRAQNDRCCAVHESLHFSARFWHRYRRPFLNSFCDLKYQTVLISILCRKLVLKQEAKKGGGPPVKIGPRNENLIRQRESGFY